MTGITIEKDEDMSTPVMVMHLPQERLKRLGRLAPASSEQTISGL
ncbi:hypothetical protein [Noviherbaspirillum malthae]|jgi:hypothetical protein|nr:hypothetical protein [Noviherbaspirillum malthae]